MSDLQLALLVLGAMIIFAVVAFNWWQERKFRQEAARFSVPDEDVLMHEEAEQDFHFDATAILKDDTPPNASIQELDEEYPENATFSENARITEEVYEDLIQRDAAEAKFVDLSVSSTPQEFNSVWDELDAEMADPPIDQPETPIKSYEEHTWQSEQYDNEITEQASAHELNDEAGFDESFKSLEAQQDENLNISNTPHADSLPLSNDIDPRVDLIAILYLAQPITGEKLREFLLSITDIDKPKYLHGLDADGVWRLVTREHEAVRFTKASCSVQLADRSGFISKNALNRFQHEVDRIGLKLNAQVEWQSPGDAWQLASDLDQFCIDVDKLVGFHLVQGSNGPFTGTKFRGLAEANGLLLGNDGGFHSENEHGLRLFSVINRDNNPFSLDMLRTSVIHGVTFQLDIPRVKNCPEIFNQMVLTARQMESSLGATLVDDNQRPIGETQIEKIRQQLKVIHAKMVARGIVPGSQSALRLFS